jgi:hypothetical protein
LSCGSGRELPTHPLGCSRHTVGATNLDDRSQEPPIVRRGAGKAQGHEAAGTRSARLQIASALLSDGEGRSQRG